MTILNIQSIPPPLVPKAKGGGGVEFKTSAKEWKSVKLYFLYF